LIIVGAMIAVIVPSKQRNSFANVSEARSFGQIEGAEILEEVGDTNGPFRLKRIVSGGVGSPFDLDLTVNGRTVSRSYPGSNRVTYIVTVFENDRGNQFAIIKKSAQ
jgi:hypothetical protein